MHEMSLTRDVVDVVVMQAQMADASRVLCVNLKIGEVHDIVDDLFVKCFAFLAKGTVAEKARIDIDRIPLTVRCLDCGEVFPVDVYNRKQSVMCPSCKSLKYTINSGNEFSIEDIEVA